MKRMEVLTSRLPFLHKKKEDVIGQISERLSKIVTKIQANASLSEVREEYDVAVGHLVALAETERDTRLQARVRNVQSTLKNAGTLVEKKDQLRLEISRIMTHLGQIAETPRFSEAAPVATAESIEEVIRAKDEIDETMATGRQLTERLQELQDRTAFMAQEIEKVTVENQAMFEENKALREQYAQAVQTHDEGKEVSRVLQNKVATAQIECNRLLLEIQFLSSERAGVLENLDGDYESLVNLSKRYRELQRGYGLVKDEAGVYEDLLAQLDSLLGRTRQEKKVLLEKTAESEKSLESLIEELRAVIKKGKVQFYAQLEGGSEK
ncbi:hypothetical protein WDW37_15085 [Bdellovibrionota bacterium FG-1]